MSSESETESETTESILSEMMAETAVQCNLDNDSLRKLMFTKLLTETEIKHIVENYRPFMDSDSCEDTGDEHQSPDESITDENKENITPREESVPKSEKSHSTKRVAKSNVCDICNKTLRDRYKLKCHKEAVHLKIKRFNCKNEGCGKGFYHKNHLANHQMTVHKKKRFNCNETFCDKQFNGKESLESHRRKEHLFVPNSDPTAYVSDFFNKTV